MNEHTRKPENERDRDAVSEWERDNNGYMASIRCNISRYQTVGLCIMGVYEVPICVNENIVLISGEILG